MTVPTARPAPPDFRPLGCRECAAGAGLPFAFSMALQPILDLGARRVFAYEALARGPAGEPAATVFAHVNDGNRYRFDQACRAKAIELAARLRIDALLSINFMPNAVYRPELCIRATLEAAERFGFPIERILFEVTESEQVPDVPHLRGILEHYRARGFTVAIDDFGAGFAGLSLLSELPTDLVKLDMGLVRGIDADPVRQAIVRGMLQVCRELGIRVVAEGIETEPELRVLRGMGVDLVQGYLFARPAFEALPTLPDGVWDLGA